MNVPTSIPEIKELLRELKSPEHKKKKAQDKLEAEQKERARFELRRTVESDAWKPYRKHIEEQIEMYTQLLLNPENTEKQRDFILGCIFGYRYVLYLEESNHVEKLKEKMKHAS